MTDEALWLRGRPYCPMDDLDGVVIEESNIDEETLLAEVGFELERLH